MIRVLFDRSSFHEANFDLLHASRLKVLCDRNVLSVIHTPVFLEETLQLYGTNRAEFSRQIPFLLNICNGGVFRDKGEIWNSELIENLQLKADIFLPAARRAALFKSMRDCSLDIEFEATGEERAGQRQNRANQRDIFNDMRSEFSKNLSVNSLNFPHHYSFLTFREAEIRFVGRLMIERLVNGVDTELILERWARSIDSYPFVTAFAEGMTYSIFYAMFRPNARIDMNAQPDFEILSYLLQADVIVSGDTRFFQDAFNELWKPRGKNLFSPIEFIDFLNKL